MNNSGQKMLSVASVMKLTLAQMTQTETSLKIDSTTILVTSHSKMAIERVSTYGCAGANGSRVISGFLNITWSFIVLTGMLNRMRGSWHSDGSSRTPNAKSALYNDNHQFTDSSATTRLLEDIVVSSVRNPYEIRIWACNPSRDWINRIQCQILDHRRLEIHIPTAIEY